MNPQSRSAAAANTIYVSVVVGVSEVHNSPIMQFSLVKVSILCQRPEKLSIFEFFVSICCQVGNPPLDELCKVCAQEVPLFLSPAWPLLPSFLSG